MTNVGRIDIFGKVLLLPSGKALCVQGKSSVTLCRDFVYLVGGSYAKVLSKSHAYSVESCE